jgi:hypothetical protein
MSLFAFFFIFLFVFSGVVLLSNDEVKRLAEMQKTGIKNMH